MRIIRFPEAQPLHARRSAPLQIRTHRRVSIARFPRVEEDSEPGSRALARGGNMGGPVRADAVLVPLGTAPERSRSMTVGIVLTVVALFARQAGDDATTGAAKGAAAVE